MSLAVRCACETDAAALLCLRRALFAETNCMLWEPEEFTATADDERKFIAWLASKTNSHLLVAEDETCLVGFLAVAGGDRNRNRHAGLVFMGVRRAHWSRGLATALLNEAISWAAKASLRRLELTVHTTNTRAVALYQRFGFEIEGTRRASLLVDGEYRDEYLMSRLLAAA
jgi:RimJ/RimL family protein N-acetyltransferase